MAQCYLARIGLEGPKAEGAKRSHSDIGPIVKKMVLQMTSSQAEVP